MAGKMYEIAFGLAGKINTSFNSTFASANNKLIGLNKEIFGINAEMKSLEKAQRAGKISNERYAGSYDILTKKLEKTERVQQRLSRAMNLQQKAGAFRQQARGNMMGAVETAIAVGAPVAAAMHFESAMADVKKVVDFDTPEQFKAMGKDIINLSKNIPMTAEGLAQIVAAGGQAGIAKEDLIGFAEAAAKMGVAFDISADDAGQMMAEWRSAFKMNQGQVNTLADQINYLGNTTAASAPKISAVVQRIGPLGEVGGAAAAQIAALGASMVATGVKEEIAATGIKNMILNLTAGEAATKSQQEAFKSLGLDAKNMAKLMQDDAQGAIMQVLESIKQLPEHTQGATLTKLFGKESVAAIAPLLTNIEALKENFEKVGDAAQYAGSMQEEFDARAATTENSLILLKNNAIALAIALGNELLPYVGKLSEILTKATERVGAFTEKHPALAKFLIVGAASVLGLTVALSGLAYVASIISSPFISLYVLIVRMTTAKKANEIATKKLTIAEKAWNLAKKAGTGLLNVGRLVLYRAKTLAIATATRAWTAAQWLWNVAMSANPIGLVILGIGALIGAGYLLIKNWDKVKEWFATLWNDPKKALNDFAEGIKEKLAGPLKWLEEKWGKLKSFFGFDNKSKPGDTAREFAAHTRGGKNIQPFNLPAHARGGIFNKPHIAWFAEEGPEAAIPLDGSKRAVSIWEKTGEILGVAHRNSGFKEVQPFNSSGHGEHAITVTYSPQFTIQGNADMVTLEKAAKKSLDDFETRFEKMLAKRKRLSFSGGL